MLSILAVCGIAVVVYVTLAGIALYILSILLTYRHLHRIIDLEFALLAICVIVGFLGSIVVYKIISILNLIN
jgi:hypothetical protein